MKKKRRSGEKVGVKLQKKENPTCNLFDWYVGVRKGIVETLWPVTARGMSL